MGFAKRRCPFSLRHDQKRKVARSEPKKRKQLVKFSALFEQTALFLSLSFYFEISHTQQPALARGEFAVMRSRERERLGFRIKY